MFERNFKIVDAASMGASVNSTPVLISKRLGYSVQAVWSGGSPVGNFKLQCSNDDVQLNSDGTFVAPTNWDDISGTTVAAGGATGSNTWNVISAYYRFFRLVYTRSSDTGTLNVRVQSKEVG